MPQPSDTTSPKGNPPDGPTLGIRPLQLARPPAARSARAHGAAFRFVLRKSAAMPEINGRPVIGRADMLKRGIGRSTLDAKYADRANSGHPEKAGRIGRTDYWYEDEWSAWYSSYQQAKRDSHTTIDRTGDPDEPIDANEAARVMRYASSRVIFSNLSHGQFVEPDAPPVQLPNGKASPRWYRRTVWNFADTRPGKGSPRAGARRSRPAKQRSAPYANDERVTVLRHRLEAGERLRADAVAGQYGVSTRTAERMISAARADVNQ
jgi:hypothetical protein